MKRRGGFTDNYYTEYYNIYISTIYTMIIIYKEIYYNIHQDPTPFRTTIYKMTVVFINKRNIKTPFIYNQ
jgi:hypothetical protein